MKTEFIRIGVGKRRWKKRRKMVERFRKIKTI
jgi:hypothetical protein